MRLVTFEAGEGARLGAVAGDSILDLVRLEMEYELSATLIRRTMHEHLRIIAALRDADSAAAAQAMDDHLTQAMHRSMWL